MKKLLVSISVCMSSLALFSCSENAVLEENFNEASVLRTKASVDEPYYVQGDGTLRFRSVNDYFAVTDSLIKLTDQELAAWEGSIGFESYRSYVGKFISEVEEAYNYDDLEKFNSLLNEYSEYIYLDTDSLVKPVIQSKTYQIVANKDGAFYLGDVRNQVDATSVYAVENKRSMSTRIPYVVSSNTRGLTDIIGYDEFSYKKADYTKMVISSCSLVKNVVLTDAQGNNFSCVQFQIFVDGKKFKRGWKHYSTTYGVKDIICKFKNIPVTVNEDQTLKSSEDLVFSHPGFDDTKSESENHTFVYDLGAVVKNYTAPIQHAACIHYKAVTGGTNPEGLGYNYAGGKYATDEDHNAGNCAPRICSLHSNVHSGE